MSQLNCDANAHLKSRLNVCGPILPYLSLRLSLNTWSLWNTEPGTDKEHVPAFATSDKTVILLVSGLLGSASWKFFADERICRPLKSSTKLSTFQCALVSL